VWGAGRLARVAIGVSPGVWAEKPTADFVADNFEAVVGEEEMIFPEQAMGEMPLIFPAPADDPTSSPTDQIEE